MPSYTLELELFGTYITDMPGLEIWEDGSLDSSYNVSSSGSTVSLTITYGGALPTSLEFRFNDASAEASRSIEIRSVKINNMYVNDGNFLSTQTLTQGSSATVNISNSPFIFDSSDPAASEFTTGATRTLTAGSDTVRQEWSTNNEIFDALDGNDRLYTGSGDDKVNGNDGNDIIRTNSGADLIFGGNGNDVAYGGTGNDKIHGGAGDDRLHGEDGADEIHGGAGDDRLNGHDDNDIITGGSGADKLHGGAGDDYLFGGTENDNLVGGAGADTLDGGDGDDLIYGGSGLDNINGGAGADVIDGGSGNDIIHGDAGNDMIYGRDDADTIYGGTGNDTLWGGFGVDTLYGGVGLDTILVGTGDFSSGEYISGGADTDDITLQDTTTVDFTIGTIDSVETLTGSAFNDDVTYTIQQALGFTTIDFGAGTDDSRIAISGSVDATGLGTPIISNAENGYLTGSTGNDTLTITGAQLNALTFGGGNIDFGAGTDVLNLTSTSTGLNGLGATDSSIVGIETISASTAGAGVTLTLSGQTENFSITGSGFADTINSGQGNDDILLANGDFAAGESIDGGAGTDEIILTGATTVDLATGTLSNLEVFTGSSGGDDVTFSASQFFDFTTINLQGGTDSVDVQATGTEDVTALTAPTVSNVENGSLSGSTGADDLTITGTQLDSLISGSGTIDFGTGADTLNLTSTSADLNTLGGTDASIAGLETIDASTAGAGVTIDLNGQTEAFTATGSAFADDITTGDGADTVSGANGNDTLSGGQGADTIHGGNGNDTIYGHDSSSSVTSLTAAEVTAILTANPGTVYSSTTNSFYQYVSSGLSWQDARSAALATDINGATGHLANITSAAENAFVAGLVTGNGDAWLGASDSGTEGEWIWMDGPEAGQQFWSGGYYGSGGTSVGGMYSSWADYGGWGEPNDGGAGPTEDYLQMWDDGSEDWNDNVGEEIDSSWTLNYVIEWDVSMMGTDDNANDILNGNDGDDIIYAGGGDDTINGGNDNDTIDGGRGNDTIDGGSGNDIIDGGSGDDTIDGGTGTDTLTYASGAAGVNVNLSITTAQNTGGAGTDTITNIENLTGTESGDTLVGSTSANTIDGGDGNDSITGGGGADTMNGGDGNDVMHGHSLTDAQVSTILGANAGVVYNAASNSFYEFVEAWTSYGSAYTDATTSTISGVTGHLVNITSAAETEFVHALADTDSWMGGNDVAEEGTFVWEHGVEAGLEFWKSGASNGGAYENWNTGEPSTPSSEDYIILEEFNGSWTDITNGPWMYYVIEWDAGLMLDDNAVDTLNGGDGDDHLYGYGGNDVLNGDAGADILFGGDGNDTLNGGAGLDIIFGGAGNDTFKFSHTDAVDTIGDFDASAGDALDIADILVGFTVGVDDIDDFIRFTTSGSDTIVSVDANGTTGGSSFTNFAVLENRTGDVVQTLYDNGDIIV